MEQIEIRCEADMTLANAHALFCGLKSEASYLANLTIPDHEHQALTAARNIIRSTLKLAASSIPVRDEYWRDSYARAVTARFRPVIQIKFMTQGSYAYGTLNAPAQVPAQEIDLDDGMYVPVQFLQDGQPALAAKGLFAFAEAALLPLCHQNGWTLDSSKGNCVRVKLWRGAHIDIPIYSIPQDRFASLAEAMEKFDTGVLMARDSMPQTWRLPSDQVMLAKRDGTWIQSDPQQLHDWVKGRSERYGAVYRRLCRFFKGWRDYTWEKSPLSSLCIMCAVDEALRRMNGYPGNSRDDELVMEVAKFLPAIFGDKVANPVINHLCLNEWSDAERKEIIKEAETLSEEMVAALERTGHADVVVTRLRNRFGTRVPYRPDAVIINSTIQAIRQAPAAKVAAPTVIPSTSG